MLVTGIGIMRATFAIATHISQARPGLIVQAGIAGSFDRKMPLGSVVVISEDTLADLGVEEQGAWRTPGDLGLEAPSLFPSSNGWFKNRNQALIRQANIPAVRGVTVNQVTTRRKSISLMNERFSPDVESMEGAACHYIGLIEKIPFLQVRAISNYVGERDKNKWKMKEAIHNLNDFLTHLLLP